MHKKAPEEGHCVNEQKKVKSDFRLKCKKLGQKGKNVKNKAKGL